MKYPLKIVFQSFVSTFYKENAGFLVFLIIVMFCIVNKVDGAAVIEYHYSLILGMLQSTQFLLLVFIIWFIWVRKFSQFVTAIIKNPEYAYLSILNNITKSKRLFLLIVVESLLLLPVLVYAIFIALIAWKLHFYIQLLAVTIYLLLLITFSAAWHTALLNNPHLNPWIFKPAITPWRWNTKSYSAILLRYISAKQTMLWIGIKIFTCGVVFLIARNNTITEYDFSFPFLFFNFGILANGILVYKIRAFESFYISFYPGLPVPMLKRFLQYAFVYFVTLIPEFITLLILTPIHLTTTDAIFLMASSYCLLLLMNSMNFIRGMGMKLYLKILFVIFCLELVIILSVGIIFLPFFLLFFAILLFIKEYYQFEPGT